MAKQIRHLDNFGKIEYKVSQLNQFFTLTDITKVISISNIGDISNYQYIRINDGERPDQLSNRLYYTPAYYWTFFLFNDFLRSGLSSWPLSDQELDEYIKKKYTPYSWLSADANNGKTAMSNMLLNEEYLPYLKLYIEHEIEGQDPIELEGISLIYYNHNKNGIIITRGSDSALQTLGLSGDNENILTLLISADITTEKGLEWQNRCLTELFLDPITYDIENDASKIYFAITIDQKFSNEQFKNAVYEYYKEDQLEDDINFKQRKISTWDAISTYREDNLPFISFLEYEKFNNENKKQIRVPRPNIVSDLVNSYHSLLSISSL